MNNKSPCKTFLIPNFERPTNAFFSLSRNPALSPSSLTSGWFTAISSRLLLSLAPLLNTAFVPTKNLPSLGSVPQKIAGDPSHLIVTLNFSALDVFASCVKFLRKEMAF